MRIAVVCVGTVDHKEPEEGLAQGHRGNRAEIKNDRKLIKQ